MAKALFILITVVGISFLFQASKEDKHILVLSIIWSAVITLLSYFNLFEKTDTLPPPFAFILLGGVLFTIYFNRRLNKRDSNPEWWWAIHGLRLPVEIGLYLMFLDQLVPKIMTFAGWDYDIIMGISAILLILFKISLNYTLPKPFLIIWNILGIILLTIIVSTAFLSTPLPIQQFAFEQPNVGILKFPFVLLPGYIVPIVIVAHLQQLRMLLKKNYS